MRKHNLVDRMSCDSCSTKEDLITCTVCEIQLCDSCFNKCMGNYIAKDGTIHDNSHVDPVTPYKFYILLNLEESKTKMLNIYGMDDFVYAVRKSGYINFKIFNQNKDLSERCSEFGLICKQTEFIPVMREFLDSLNYPEDFIDNIVKDLYNSSKEYKSINILFYRHGGHKLESEDITHLKSPLIAWRGSSKIAQNYDWEKQIRDDAKLFKIDRGNLVGNYTRTVEIYQVI
jgi:hypothetical protein